MPHGHRTIPQRLNDQLALIEELRARIEALEKKGKPTPKPEPTPEPT
jgi:hypothetical protein